MGQAQVIERAIRRLPNDVDADVKAEVEAFLLERAQFLDTDDLDKAGRHLYEVIAPENAERRIGKQLEEQERRARENRTLSFGPVRDGMGTMFLRLDVPTLAILQALLDPSLALVPRAPTARTCAAANAAMQTPSPSFSVSRRRQRTRPPAGASGRVSQ
nr:DUF222 domain-containing protein [Actinopolymorpha pittospori]